MEKENETMMDLAVINGLVFIEGGFRKADVGIKNGKFALIAEPGCLPEAERTIDAGGKYVLPGGIDTHVHYRDPGHWERETFEVGTRAAAAGGCTTFFEHPISMPPQWNGEILKNRISICKGEESAANDRHEKGSCVDFCFFGAAGGEHPEAIEPLSHEGIIAYKTFLHEAPEGRDAEFEGLTSANNDQLYRVLEEVKKTGLAVAAHAEDNELVTGFIKRLREQGRQTENIAHCESRPPIVEIEAISKMLKFGKDVGCPIELVHVSTWQAMELAKKAKAEGQPVMVETCPHYLLLDESYVEKYGAYAKCNPALRKKEDVERLWDYVKDGTIDFIGSDHSPFLVSEKEKKDKDGNKKTDFIPCEQLGKHMENLVQYLTKGKLVEIDGELHIENWKDETGNWKSFTSVKVEKLNFVSVGKKEEQEPTFTPNFEPQGLDPQGFQAIDDDDIPF